MLEIQQKKVKMKKYDKILLQSPLFADINKADFAKCLGCLGAKVKSYAKNQLIFTEGDPATSIGIVLSGEVQIIKEDYYGNRSIVALIEPAQIFAEAFACAQIKTLPVSVISVCDSEIMLIDYGRIMTTCTDSCEFHNRLIHNLLRVVAMNNILLNRKIELVSKRTTKEKLMAYLMSEAKQAGNRFFTIPYSRQELADYLGVERSAMSAELGKLRDEGLIEFQKSRFKMI